VRTVTGRLIRLPALPG